MSFKLNPLLLLDFYKVGHEGMYPDNMTKLVSYYTPRKSRLNSDKELVHFGLQYFIKEYLIDGFNENFFLREKSEVINEYRYYIENTYNDSENDLVSKIADLYDLGYLPIEIHSLPEGTIVPMQIPCVSITNTHPDFAWLVNSIESLMSATLWHAQLSASVGYWYRKIVNKYYELTCDDSIQRNKALGDFSFRGQESLESAVISSAGFLTSFLLSATVPTGYFMEKYYNANVLTDDVVYGSVSTEHSVMCSNFAVDGDEITMVKKLLTKTYKNTSFSLVSDSYDYWNLINEILPQCKKEILRHNGCLLIRGDSGDPIEIITETVFRLWDIFGGSINSKGYKVLDKHIKAIYGDSITVQRCEEIYKILQNNGFACSNVALGVGSFSMQCVEEENILKPFTRDSYSSAVKSTYCEVNGKPINIFKNPKTDSGHFKKSQKGCCFVYEKAGKLFCEDEKTWEEANVEGNKLQLVYKDGVFYQDTLTNIRDRLNKGNF